MSAEQVNALIAAAVADPGIAGRLAEAVDAQHAVAIAADLGFDVTAGELAALATAQAGELADYELEGAAGGGSPSLDPMLCPTGHCQSMYGLGCG